MIMNAVHDMSLSAIDLNLLVVLEALLAERHVTRAARRVGLSQSAVSHALGRLRELYDDPLLVRSGSAMDLTPRAVALRPVVQRGLAELRTTFTGEPPFEPKTARRTFSIGSADYGQSVLLPSLMELVAREAPFVDLTLANAPSLLELVENGQVDVALVVGHDVPSSLRTEELFSDGFVCMVRQGHPTVSSKLTLSSYLGLRHLVVAPSGTAGSIVDTELARRGKERRVALRVSSFLVAPFIVSGTDYVNTGPERVAKLMSRVHRIRLLPPPLSLPRFTLCLAWHTRFDADPPHRWLRGAVTRAARALATD